MHDVSNVGGTTINRSLTHAETGSSSVTTRYLDFLQGSINLGAGAWLGWQPLAGLVAGASLSALAFAIITGQRRLAFGPWLAGAFWLIWVGRISA